jgi:CRISPR/Cas system-associated endonuclease Cas1
MKSATTILAALVSLTFALPSFASTKVSKIILSNGCSVSTDNIVLFSDKTVLYISYCKGRPYASLSPSPIEELDPKLQNAVKSCLAEKAQTCSNGVVKRKVER